MKAQFMLRDLMWLTVVVGLAVGWWADRTQAVRGIAKERDQWIQNTRRLSLFIFEHGHGAVTSGGSGRIIVGDEVIAEGVSK